MKSSEKHIQSRMEGHYTMDGAGVRLLRVFGGQNTFERTDPFLLMDYFGSSIPEEYEKGFPWHPHRGIETVTFQIKGRTDHEDSNGNRGIIRSGDVQDMIAGSGIFHEEMPKVENESSMDRDVLGLQLWINTPSKLKMMKPLYAFHSANSMGRVKTDGGSLINVIAGNFEGTPGPFSSPYDLGLTYFHMKIKKGDTISLTGLDGQRSILFGYSGKVRVSDEIIEERVATALSVEGDYVEITGISDESDVIFISGNPTYEHIEWYGPIVMNSKEEVNEALKDLRNGTFVREKEPTITS